jgi:hypothetical protein
VPEVTDAFEVPLLPEDLATERYCLLTTEGRVTARRHTAELWFVPADGGVHLMSGSGGLTQWYLNLQAEERAVLRIGKATWLTRAAFLSREDPLRADALDRFHDEYDPPGKDRRESWLRDATVAHLVVIRQLT